MVLAPGTVDPNGTLVARLWARGSGRLQGLSARLVWDATVVEYAGMDAGELLRAQAGVVLAPEPGVIDVALLGTRERGLLGEGSLVEVRFRVLGPGDPGLALASADGRDGRNGRVQVEVSRGGSGSDASLPHVTRLLANVPNPFNPATRIEFTLAEPGRVELGIYTVDGRRVRTLLQADRAAGLHAEIWDGRDDRGVRLASGAYYARLVTRDGTYTRPLVMLK
jgi:hypothetical protein